MRLNALLLADAVSAPPDGKFYIHGGGLTRITVPVLPFALPQLGVFIRLEADPEDLGRTYAFRLVLIDPDGVAVGPLPQFEAPLPERMELVEGEQQYVVLALNVPGVTFGRSGLHRFEFWIGEELFGSIPLPVVALTAEQLQAMTSGTPPAVPSQQRPNRAARRR